ncbi:MAG TPA: GlsB/YeaQ/YmgE family stress response membrane protein [Candidatus Limnocylindria bacterium]|nr:GlsB/YeaQ/YmgE family stress response membrane protein [Candidatus Limnocylindria bacterium]
MDIILAILFGLYAGWMASGSKNPLGSSIILGILGALASSLFMKSLGWQGVYAYNTYSFFVAIIGAVSCVYIGHILLRQSFKPKSLGFIFEKPPLILKPIIA